MRKVGLIDQQIFPSVVPRTPLFWPCKDENDHDEGHKLNPSFDKFCYAVFIARVRGVLPLLCV